MTSKPPTESYFQALERLETCLETPIVPGELPQWSEDVCAAVEEVSQEFAENVLGVHAGIYQDIVSEDPGLDARVDELRRKDDRLQSQLAALASEFKALCKSANDLEPDEARLADQIDAATQHGLDFVIQSRKQEHALSTWYLEAFERDRGTAD